VNERKTGKTRQIPVYTEVVTGIHSFDNLVEGEGVREIKEPVITGYRFEEQWAIPDDLPKRMAEIPSVNGTFVIEVLDIFYPWFKSPEFLIQYFNLEWRDVPIVEDAQ